MKALTQDESLVEQALTTSTIVTLTEGRIKSNVKMGRYTIILRDIPSDAPEEEVREIFNYENCRPITSIRSEMGNNWFITMETEEDAKDTLLDLRIKKRLFRGEAVKGRLKSESIVKSFYPYQPALPPVPIVPFAGFMPPPPMMFPYPVSPDMPVNIEMGEHMSSDSQDTTYIVVDEVVKDLVNSAAGGQKKRTPPAQAKERSGKPVIASAPAGRESSVVGKDKRLSRVVGKVEDKKPVIDISPVNFPPLVPVDDSIPTPGYKSSYVKYTMDEIISIVGNITEAQLPDTIVPVRTSTSLMEVINSIRRTTPSRWFPSRIRTCCFVSAPSRLTRPESFFDRGGPCIGRL